MKTSFENSGIGDTALTRQMQAEDALSEANARVRAVLDAATRESIIATDLNGMITIFNTGAERMLGYSAKELVGKQTPAIMHLESEVVARGKELTEEFGRPIEGFDIFVEYARQGRYEERDWTYVRKDGEHLTVSLAVTVLRDSEDNITGFLGIARDITQRKKADKALFEANARAQAVLDAATQESIISTDLNGMITIFNTGAERMLGYSAEEVVGKQTPAIMHLVSEVVARGKELTAEFGRPIEGFDIFIEYARQGRYEERDWTYVRKNGEHLTVNLAVTALRDREGNITGFLGVARDITEQKNLEQQKQAAFERRGHEVQVSTEISQGIAAASELSDLFGRVVTLTKERLGYYHTQLLRYDASQDAVVLISGYGETGQKMFASGHKLPMGTGLIGTAAASGKTVLRPVLTEDPDWRSNPLLPETRGEIAVPIKLGDQILGVLDVQSDQAGALTDDDRLLLEGLCGQIAVAIEQTRLRQEMAERLEEINRLYRSMSQEGWKTYRDTADLPAGFMYDQAGIQPVDEAVLTDELFANIPMKALGGEVVGTLTIANDPQHPTSPEDYAFLQQVSDQIALALESARLFGQTQTALAQTEKLSAASLRFAQAADLQEVVKIATETLDIPKINRAVLGIFHYTAANDLESLDVVANWWNGTGQETTPVGTHYSIEMLRVLPLFMSTEPVFFNDTPNDERADPATLEIIKKLNIRSIAVLPLFLGARQIGVLLLEAEEIHNFTQAETRLFSAMGPQIATVLENRRQFERAQRQAQRETTLNVISQKIQGATSVEEVLQIAARELGHALGAPRTIAQLSLKDKK